MSTVVPKDERPIHACFNCQTICVLFLWGCGIAYEIFHLARLAHEGPLQHRIRVIQYGAGDTNFSQSVRELAHFAENFEYASHERTRLVADHLGPHLRHQMLKIRRKGGYEWLLFVGKNVAANRTAIEALPTLLSTYSKRGCAFLAQDVVRSGTGVDPAFLAFRTGGLDDVGILQAWSSLVKTNATETNHALTSALLQSLSPDWSLKDAVNSKRCTATDCFAKELTRVT